MEQPQADAQQRELPVIVIFNQVKHVRKRDMVTAGSDPGGLSGLAICAAVAIMSQLQPDAPEDCSNRFLAHIAPYWEEERDNLLHDLYCCFVEAKEHLTDIEVWIHVCHVDDTVPVGICRTEQESFNQFVIDFVQDNIVMEAPGVKSKIERHSKGHNWELGIVGDALRVLGPGQTQSVEDSH